MKPNRIRAVLPRVALCLLLTSGATRMAWAAEAEPPGAALVIGAATYTALPGQPACARSANLVSATLRNLGFEVTERLDASAGSIDAGIGEFSGRVAAGRRTAFLYVCGYGAGFNDRLFLLPVTARIARPSDMLTQGILVKSLMNALAKDGIAGAAVFDMVPMPGATAPMALETLTAMALPEGVGTIAVAEKPLSDGPTPLAAALAAALAGPVVRTDGAMNRVLDAMTAAGVLVAVRMPVSPGYLAGAPRPRPAAPTLSGAPSAAALPGTLPGALPAGAGDPPVSGAAPAKASPSAVFPDEERMTELDRRELQIALARLSYYKGSIDGVFGVATRAAIERFQTGLGAAPTGRLTGEQASRLVTGNR